MARVRTIEDLRRELQVRERQLGKLQTKRDRLLIQLNRIDRQIAGMGGEVVAAPKVRRGRPAGRPAAADGRRGRRRRATGRPLTEFIRDVLAKASEGMRAKDIAEQVQKGGYKSHSKDFYGIVAATLRDTKNFKRLSRGIYKLK